MAKRKKAEADPRAALAARLFAADQFPYLSTGLWSLTMVERPGVENGSRCDRRGRYYFDPARIAAWPLEEAAGDIIHKLWHILDRHPERCDAIGATPQRGGLAGCLALNGGHLAKELVRQPSDRDNPTPLKLGFQSGLPLEGYYDLLPDEPPASGGCGSCSHGTPEPHEDHSDKDGDDDQAQPAVSDAEWDLIRQSVAQEIERAAARGTVPAGWQRWAKGILRPKFDPARELASAVRGSVATRRGARDRTYSRPGRRQSAGVVMPASRDPVVRVDVVIDTSGSMTDDLDLALSLGVIARVLRSFAGSVGVRVISCDAAVHAVNAAFRLGSVQLAGGGGTDLEPGIRHVDQELEPPADVAIICTDCQLPVESWGPEPRRVRRWIAALTRGGGEVPGWIWKTVLISRPNGA